jgi:small subunit ribosomal protein S11
MGLRGSKRTLHTLSPMAAEDCSEVAIEAGLKKTGRSVAGRTDGRELRIFFA